MFVTVGAALVAALLAGIVVRFALRKANSQYEITKSEVIVGGFLVAFVVAPLVGYIGWNLARQNQVTFYEYLNGWETAVRRENVSCTRDGSCHWDYDCDPYEEYVSETCTDSKGRTYECGRYETLYHSCPYVKVETTYVVETTLGAYTISENRFPDDPQSHRWRRGKSIPASVIASAGTGIPRYWVEVKERIESHNPNPVTTRRAYENYILASDKTILKQYSSDIDTYRDQGMLPAPMRSITDFYDADKVSFVGYQPQSAGAWQEALSRLNAELGAELQGDVQVVVVQNDAISANPDRYTLALKAYWQDTRVFGKDAFSKNGIGIVLGTSDGKTVVWARAFTGMPLGNEQLLAELQGSLKGRPLDPREVLGSVTVATSVTFEPNYWHLGPMTVSHTGTLAEALWGDYNQATRFARVGMTGKGSGQGSGHLYLYSEIEPTSGQMWWIAITVFVLGCVVWFALAVINMQEMIHGFSNRR
jgi:hypothetical protein